jgi:hypothetical protein
MAAPQPSGRAGDGFAAAFADLVLDAPVLEPGASATWAAVSIRALSSAEMADKLKLVPEDPQRY